MERHKRLRQGKGFLTIEQPTEVHQAVHKMKNKGQAVLLECMSNLTANEMFGEQMLSAEAAVCKIMDDIQTLQKNVRHLIIVSNNVFEDGVRYDESTMAYLSALGEINCRLSVMADRVIEVAAGLPIILKGSVTEDEAD